jgi:hypothetical protein
MNERKRRVAENEAIFRAVNEQLSGLAASVATQETRDNEVEIVCECGAQSCTDRITIPQADYRRTREDSTLFLLRPGHDDPEAETVVARATTYWIVRKRPGTGESVSRALDTP